VGIIERDVGMYNEEGFDPYEVKMFMQKNSSLANFAHAKVIETTDTNRILKLPCDIFAPCATDGSLNAGNMKKLSAKVVLEGANGPTTFKAD